MCRGYSPITCNMKTSDSIIAGNMQTMVATTDFAKLSSRNKCIVPKETNKMKSKVSFAPMVSMWYTIARSDYTKEEEKAVWYNEQDYKEISKRCRKEIGMTERGETLRDHKYCSRGLEGYTRLGAVARTQKKRLVWDQVLAAQYYHGTWDSEMIAKVCADTTASSDLAARRVGRLDHQAVEKYLAKDSFILCHENKETVFKENNLEISSPKQEPRDWDEWGRGAQRIFTSRQA